MRLSVAFDPAILSLAGYEAVSAALWVSFKQFFIAWQMVALTPSLVASY